MTMMNLPVLIRVVLGGGPGAPGKWLWLCSHKFNLIG